MEEEIYDLFQAGEYEFFSIDSISRLTNIDDKSKIEQILNSDERFRRAHFRTKNEQPTYALSSKKISFSEKLCQLLTVAATQYNPV